MRRMIHVPGELDCVRLVALCATLSLLIGCYAPAEGDEIGEAAGMLTSVPTISAGVSHACVLANGSTKCFGRNLFGGTGQYSFDRGLEAVDMGDNLPAVDLGPAADVSDVARGAYHTCALLTEGSVRCWGANHSGALGLGDTMPRTSGNTDLAALPAVQLGTGKRATAITAGSGFSCAILNDGAVKCWGDNSWGQLGLGDTQTRGDSAAEMGDALPAVDLGTGRRATAIAAGSMHVCAVLEDGALKCWGYNGFGGLGLEDWQHRGDSPGEMGDALPPIKLGTGRKAASVSLGPYQTCAVLDDRTAKCWGYNAWGQLGRGDTETRGDGAGEMGDGLTVIDFGPGRTVKSLSVAGHSACAILDNDTLKCWGYNTDGQLGLGDTAHRGDQPGEMGQGLPPVSLGTGRTARFISGQYGNQCAALDNGEMKCWGVNWPGSLGIGPTDNRGDAPAEMGDALPGFNFGNGLSIVSVGSGFGYHHGCAIVTDVSTSPANECENHGCKKKDCKHGHGHGCKHKHGKHGCKHKHCEHAGWHGCCEHKDCKHGHCQGHGHCNKHGHGQGHGHCKHGHGHGHGHGKHGHGHGCTQKDCKHDHGHCGGCCEPHESAPGQLKCWGANSYGQLGIDRSSNVGDEPGDMGLALAYVDLAGGSVVSVRGGESHSCALLSDGRVKCWGANRYGTLGQGDTRRRDGRPSLMGTNLPYVDLGTGRTAMALSVGANHSCVVLDTGAVKCWGLNSEGQLGLGDTESRGDSSGEMGDALPFVDLGVGRTAVAVSAGHLHTCAVLDDNSVKCWGANRWGQLGLGAHGNRGAMPGEMGDALPPVALGTGRTATSAVAGVHNTCALLDDGSTKCWGTNGFGQLGQGDTVFRGKSPTDLGDNLAPIDFGTGRRAISLGMGDQHVCALLDNGAVKCWGNNALGKLGYGDGMHRGDNPGEMGDALPAVDLGTGRTTLSLASGWYHNCAVLDDSTVKCWGRGTAGELGTESSIILGDQPGQMGDALLPIALGLP